MSKHGQALAVCWGSKYTTMQTLIVSIVLEAVESEMIVVSSLESASISREMLI